MDEAQSPRASGYILVVEDDPDVGDMMAALLEVEGYDVALADSGIVAINMLAAVGADAPMQHAASPVPAARLDRPPDLILLDLQLPTMDGAHMVQHLRRMGQPVPPIIVVSARQHEAVDVAAESIGAAGVVYKPFQIEDLLGAIERALAPAMHD